MARSVFVVFVFASLWGCDVPGPNDAPPPSVAKAGDILLTQDDVDLRVDALRELGTEGSTSQLRRLAAEQVFLRKLLAREARRAALDRDPILAAELRRLDEAVALDIYSFQLAGSDTLPEAELEAELAPLRPHVDADQFAYRARRLRELYRLQLGTERRASEVDVLEAGLQVWIDPEYLTHADTKPLEPVARAGDIELLAVDVDRFLPSGPATLRIPVDQRMQIIRSALAMRVLARRKIVEGILQGPFAERREADVDEVLARAARDTALKESLAKTPILAEGYYQEHQQEFALPEEVHVRHLLIAHQDAVAPHPGRTRAQAQALADELLGRLRAGQSFEALSQQYSDLPGRAFDLGYFPRGSGIEPTLEEAAFRTTRGDFAGPIETRHGFHLLQVLDRRVPGFQSFADARESLTARLEAERRQQVEAELENRLRGSLTLELDPSYFGR